MSKKPKTRAAPREPLSVKVARVEKALRADIRKTLRQGYRWDARQGALHVNGHWVPAEAVVEVGAEDGTGLIDFVAPQQKQKACGVCAVAACVIARQLPYPQDSLGFTKDVAAVAKELRAPCGLIDDVYIAVMAAAEEEPPPRSRQGYLLGYRLARYAESFALSLKKAKEQRA